jgi:colanic acid/amylovoran biosynthesis glycosyltransferase
MTDWLRIGLFVHEFPALSETFVLSQVTGLIDLGCDVRIFATDRRPDGFEHADVRRYELQQRTCYLNMPRGKLRRLLAAIPLFLRNWRSPRIWRSINLFRYGREALSLKLFYWTNRLAEAESRFDIIYCHFGVIGRTAAFLREIGALDGVLVTAFHGVDVSASLGLRPGLYHHLFHRGDAFLPISRHWGARLQAHGCDPDRILVQHMGVDLSRFRFKPRDPDPAGPIRLLTVGRLVEKKGIAYALQAVARARDDGLHARYTIIGDGPLRQILETLADELQLRDVVTFLGWRDQEAVVAEMYDHDILVASSVTDPIGDQEGIPVTLMEAMATGMPVISTRHSGIPELVRNGTSGFLLAEGDVEGLATALGKLSRDPALRAEMGYRGREIVAAEFEMAALNRRLLRIFREVTGDEPIAVESDRVEQRAYSA